MLNVVVAIFCKMLQENAAKLQCQTCKMRSSDDRQHKVLLECVAQELHNDDFDNLTAEQQLAVREDAKERCISHSFPRQSGKQHANLKVDLQNDFTTGDNRYPKTRQSTLHLLDKCSKTVVTKTTQSEGAAFVQKGGKGGKGQGWQRPKGRL